MDIKITKELDNDFFKRKDIEVEISHKGQPTPRASDIRSDLAKQYKVDDSQVKIDYILTTRGIGSSKAKAKIMNEKPVVVKKEETSETPPASQPEQDKGEDNQTQTG